ncbi:MAG TPA: hypothetical protein VG797_05625 [Phycisphaerales bacterium]|nr:hypothetical protein [Phycisphaerales bacterium]
MATTTPNSNGTCKTDTCTTNTFGAFADCMSESLRAGFDMNRRVFEAWNKTWATPTQPFNPTRSMARWTGFVTGMTEQTTRAMTEMTSLMTEQTKVATTMTERMTKTFTGMVATPTTGTMPTETREIVTEAIDATAKNTERLTRMGLANFQKVTGLVEEACETACA